MEKVSGVDQEDRCIEVVANARRGVFSRNDPADVDTQVIAGNIRDGPSVNEKNSGDFLGADVKGELGLQLVRVDPANAQTSLAKHSLDYVAQSKPRSVIAAQAVPISENKDHCIYNIVRPDKVSS